MPPRLPLRVLRCPPEGANPAWGGPARDCIAPTLAAARAALPPPQRELPTQADVQGQVDHHARNNSAQHGLAIAFAHKEEGHRGGDAI